MPSVFSFVFSVLRWDQPSCAVCSSYSWSSCNVNKIQNKTKKASTSEPWRCSIRKQLYPTWTRLDDFFFPLCSGETSTKKRNNTVITVTVVLFLFNSDYCVLYCRNPKNKVAYQAIIYSTMISVCVYYLFCTYFSDMVSVSDSICFYLCSKIVICFT